MNYPLVPEQARHLELDARNRRNGDTLSAAYREHELEQQWRARERAGPGVMLGTFAAVLGFGGVVVLGLWKLAELVARAL